MPLVGNTSRRVRMTTQSGISMPGATHGVVRKPEYNLPEKAPAHEQFFECNRFTSHLLHHLNGSATRGIRVMGKR